MTFALTTLTMQTVNTFPSTDRENLWADVDLVQTGVETHGCYGIQCESNVFNLSWLGDVI